MLRPIDLLPTLRAGLTAGLNGEPLWLYYDSVEKRVYGAENASAVAPAIRQDRKVWTALGALEQPQAGGC